MTIQDFGREVETSGQVEAGSHEIEDIFSNADKDFMMGEFSAPLIASFLYDQLDAMELESTRNILAEILQRISFLKERFEGDAEVLAHIKEVKMEILVKTAALIGTKFNFELSEYDISSDNSSYDDMVEEIYEFFVINRKAIIIMFLVNFIQENSKNIVAAYKKNFTRSNQTFKEIKNKFSPELAYLYMIIPSYIEDQLPALHSNIDLSEFVRLLHDFGYSEGLAIDTITDSDDTAAILDPLLTVSIDPYMVSDIACRVRGEIFSAERFESMASAKDKEAE